MIGLSEATGLLDAVWLLVAIPAASAAVLLLAGRRADRWGHLLGVASVGVAFVLGLVMFIQLGGLDDQARGVEQKLWDFIAVGDLQVEFGLLFDPLSAVFVLLITGVGFLIHVYAVGYMAEAPHDQRHESAQTARRRFFGYFNLFVAAMLLLVLGNNYLLLYLGWEGVGLASYLLISFWYGRPSATTAGKKAFLMNRVGDAGFVIAIFLMVQQLGTVEFNGVFEGIEGTAGLSQTTILVLGLLLLLGATGKSGQFPLQAWLPDAMEGPTPVSALIHAATMVTAGVYLIARSHVIFSANLTLQTVVVSVGAATLLIGAIIGCAKDDIKRVLAWSTVSQIGYMFLAVGLGGVAYALGLIHLLAHGFFKAGLFLGAGSVMHGMQDQVDIRRFGGLSRYLPITWVTFGLAWLAIIGLPPLSGFFTKDPIIAAAFDRPGWTGWLFGGAALLGAGITAFYMTRLFVLTFHGPKRWTEGQHPHESPPVMTVPLILLAVGTVAAGWLMSTSVVDWLAPVVGEEEVGHGPLSHGMVTVLTMAVVVIGGLGAWGLFRNGTALAPAPAGPVVTAARANLYGDAVNEVLFEKPGRWLTRALVYVDIKGVDGLVNGLAAAIGGTSSRVRRLQTGFVRSYAASMLLGAVLIIGAFIAVNYRWFA
jgi:NADH-quinone oxidoreductase subunit L